MVFVEDGDPTIQVTEEVVSLFATVVNEDSESVDIILDYSLQDLRTSEVVAAGQESATLAGNFERTYEVALDHNLPPGTDVRGCFSVLVDEPGGGAGGGQ
jgi:hypothetical protein